MCGIAGALNLDGRYSAEELSDIVSAMTDSMPHRGPDDRGVWVSPDRRCALGHRRLSIIDTSSAARQPMADESGAVITYNGELYNHLELRANLSRAGTTFRTRSDTEVFLAGLAQHGTGWFPKVDAMFALGFFDPHRNSLILARDAFGEKPLYYTVQNGLFAFASELQALTRIPGFSPVVDDESIALYLSFQYIPAPRTIYRSCRKLPPGCYLEAGEAGIGEPVRYYRFITGSAVEATASLDEQADALEEVLLRSLRRRLLSDVPLGAFLSGGVDSSTAVALITRRLNRPIQTFSIGFEGTASTEHEAARAIAAHLGTEHQDQMVAPADIEEMSSFIAARLDEPNGDSSCLPTYLLSELTRRHVTVAISGDGGDEVFGGYDRYFHCEAAVARNRERIADGSWHAGRDYYSSRILTFDDRDLSLLCGGMPAAAAAELARLRGYIDMDRRPLVNVLRELDAANYLPGAVLAKVDRMSMQHSLEVRTPYLSVDVAEFGARLSASQISAGFSGKLVLKRLASRYLPADWMERPKMGFGLPMTSWAEESLRARTLALLSEPDARLTQWLPPEAVRSFFEQREQAISVYQLWSLRILEHWLRSHPAIPATGFERPSAGHGSATAPVALAPAGKDLEKDLEPVYDAILSGRMKVVGWGAIATLPCYVAQSPFPIDYIVDSDPSKWGTSICGIPIRPPQALSGEKPDAVIVVVFPFYSPPTVRQILTQLEGHGRFRAIPPFRAELDGAVVRTVVARLAREAGEGGAPPLLQRALSVLDDSWSEDTPALIRSVRARLSAERAPAVSRRVRLVIGSLQAGGAERQICYLAVGLKRQGWDVALLAFAATQPGAEHYAAMLEHEGVPLEVLPSARDHFAEMQTDDRMLEEFRISEPLLKRLPSYLIHWTLVACRRFVADRPELVICYLDVVNLSAGLGALLAGVGHVLLSGRNLHPGHLPNHYGDDVSWMQECYRHLSRFPEVILSANSKAGARSYAEWLGLPRERVHTVPNGIPAAALMPPVEAVEAVRAALGVGTRTPLIVGVFRLAEEKRPLLFVEVIRRLHEQGVPFKAALVGDGLMADAVRAAVERSGLSERLLLLGVREDVRTVVAASDLVLHVALVEGHPNALMEAQLLGRPVVASRAEGTQEILAPVHRLRLCSTDDDGTGLAAHCRAVLDSLEETKQAAAEAAPWVANCFSIDRLVTNTLASAGLPVPA
nr:asparagine synthase (glutamine-hydrolyzing) [Azospirillum brasilense]